MQRIIRKISAFLSRSSHNPASFGANQQPEILTRQQHHISRELIDKNALDVLYGLKRANFEAYLVGGGVRDLLLGLEPKDFDIATNAEPEQIKRVFKHRCRLIGRRFRLAHVRFGRNVIEVATFRGNGEGESKGKRLGFGRHPQAQSREVDETGRLVRDNIYGTIDEDVWRRDFTVNALYYNIKDFSILDYVGGLEDIEKGQLRLIGDPYTRYREDPVRLIRAIRFAAKLGFKIESKTEEPIHQLGSLLKDVSHARMFEEVLKLFHSGVATEVLEKLRHYDLFGYLFPMTDDMFDQDLQANYREVVLEALKSTDRRINSGMSVNPSFLFAAMLWGPLMLRRAQHLEQGLNNQDALFAAANDVIEKQVYCTAIPKRFTAQIRDIWGLQFRLPNRHGDRAQKLMEHPRFRAAYDFLGIRAASGETELQAVFDWWTEYQEKEPVERIAFANEVKKNKPKKRTRRNRNFFRKRSQGGSQKGDSDS
ncbi:MULTISPECIES: polynucleotide adenylyltransferase PcnB [Thiomicrorhabdus]|uniref:Poly(A) polymerase I n=1 Tax=Thiomicrorhabdus heinhorstiae TaxID=2748010 RepID=A0ABS0C057_9GAMM|nr:MULTISPECIES: polynucleotide adenylyltransferase PcnB [Thiomicrorhabdus]MBF6058718.1 polynucleotide adenylyltransferase PcnB [Thiomicrorhabdus heinhorstiae]